MALDTFPVLKMAKEGIWEILKNPNVYAGSVSLDLSWNYKISRVDLIHAGIDSNWFLDENQPANEIENEIINLKNLR